MHLCGQQRFVNLNNLNKNNCKFITIIFNIYTTVCNLVHDKINAVNMYVKVE